MASTSGGGIIFPVEWEPVHYYTTSYSTAARNSVTLTAGPGYNWVYNNTLVTSNVTTATGGYQVTAIDDATLRIITNQLQTAAPATHYTPVRTQPVWAEEAYQNLVHEADEWANDAETQQRLARVAQEAAELRQLHRERENTRLAEFRRREQLTEEDRLIAHSRALELLRMVLSPEQRRQMESEEQFEIRGSAGGLYLIRTAHGVHGNIMKIDEHGCRLGSVCVAPSMRDEEGFVLPIPDGWVGQVLGLRYHETEFLSHGNWSRRRECQHQGVPILGVQAA